jgi:hypothetical protein
MGLLISVSNNTPLEDSSASVVVQSAGQGVFFSDNFNGGITGWSELGSNVRHIASGGIDGGGYLRVEYRGAGTAAYVVKKNVDSFNLNEVYIKFDFRQSKSGENGGSKFLKLFGKINQPVGYANSTFVLNYASNKLTEVGYGNGSATVNDAQQLIRYGGNPTDPAVVMQVAKGVFDPGANIWHNQQVYMKYSTNGNRDGVYKVWIDGILWVHATNVKNRHDSNSREFGQIRLADYNNGNNGGTFDLDYDNVVMSRDFIA